jgi:hypothetical protein
VALEWPIHLSFDNIALAAKVQKRVSLASPASVPLDFVIDPPGAESGFSVSPTQGCIPGSGCVDFTIKFQPLELHTHVATFTGHVDVIGGFSQRCQLSGTVCGRSDSPRQIALPAVGMKSFVVGGNQLTRLRHAPRKNQDTACIRSDVRSQQGVTVRGHPQRPLQALRHKLLGDDCLTCNEPLQSMHHERV